MQGDDRPIHQVRSDGRIIGEIRADTPVFVISVAAELAGMHAQTLRSYDREGLVSPRRTTGGGRRYSQRDIELLQQVQQLSQDAGVNRAGIRRIMELEKEVDALKETLAALAAEISSLRDGGQPREGNPACERNDPRGRHKSDGSDEHAALARRTTTDAVVPFRTRTTTVVTFRTSGS